ncbi:GAF domain-containing protein [Rhizobium sp. NFR12]|uniref:GAF domain-containing protein n=1 Tax=Rhizobium/Agrobacterium group TaxID=227290 RepID=UPI0008A74C14|nr:GAF domain-containing protein [Rhizobium sp. NFR12]SEH22253.1 GAF domain-containing protein [Rhizobium sp. NFR12]
MLIADLDEHAALLDRLEALEAYDIMDSPSEPEFDGIVQIATALCKAPVALISLVDAERQWFKARVGFSPSETPLSQSVCRHALASSDLLIIPDLKDDPRTCYNTLVTGEPFIRFYAGAPLITPDNITIGSLCVIDSVPRPHGLDNEQREGLRALAGQVIALFEARRLSQRKDDLFRRQKSLTSHMRAAANETLAAQEAGGVGTFEVDIETGQAKTSPAFCRIFHLPVAPIYPSSLFEGMVVESDRGLQSSDLGRREATDSLDVEYRINTDVGIRWISRTASFVHDESGRPIKMIGAVKDVTVIKRAAARVQALLDLGDRLNHLTDTESMAMAAADLMAKALDATRAGFGIVNLADETVLMQPEWTAPGVVSLSGRHHFRDYGSFINDLRLGNPVVIPDVTQDPRTRDNAQALLDLDIRVLVNVPIMDQGRFNLVVFAHHTHPYAWSTEELAFLRSFGDRIQAAIARVHAEAEQMVLQRELGHRLKNTLAMVQAIASQTLRPVKERNHVDAFERRLHALSTAHEILLERNWSSAPVSNVVEKTLDRLSVRERIDIVGDPIMLGPKGTLSLSLVLHELATNAIKYGSLSNTTGRVAINWHVEGEGDLSSFNFSWQESGGPQVAEPQANGFGSKLIRMGLAGTGGVNVRYEPSGFVAQMHASLPQLQQADI